VPDKYLYRHRAPDSLASGRPLADYDTVPAAAVDTDNPHDAALIADGKLIDTQPKAKRTASKEDDQ
jgi:hypothetical protein